MTAKGGKGVSLRDPPNQQREAVKPELLELALRRRVERIEKLLEGLERKGVDVDGLLDELYQRDGNLRELWKRVNSDILERSAEGKVSVQEALEWIDTLDRWAEAVTARLRDLAGEGNGGP